MRIWDLARSLLCRQHLLGEHRELHGLWQVLTLDKTGYSRPQETLRWRGKLRALYLWHEELVAEMARRGYRYASPLDPLLATGAATQIDFVDLPERQRDLFVAKGCDCAVGDGSGPG